MNATLPFRSRAEAGRLLAARLKHHREHKPVVIALPRGGVPVAAEIARALDAPLDLMIVRKIGVPWQPELAAGAIADGTPPKVILNEDVIREADVDEDLLMREAAAQETEIERRRKIYLKGRKPVDLAGRTAIIVDDGIATGATLRAALVALRRRSPMQLVLAVPVAPAETLAKLRPLLDETICLSTPDPFLSIGTHYLDFHQVSDDEVLAALAAGRTEAVGLE